MMASPLTEAREVVAGALAGAGVRVYQNPVETPAPPCLQITGSEDWVTGKRLAGGIADVSLNVRATVAVAGGNTEALEALEALVWTVMGMVPVVGTLAAPRLETQGQTDVYVVDMTTRVTARNDEGE